MKQIREAGTALIPTAALVELSEKCYSLQILVEDTMARKIPPSPLKIVSHARQILKEASAVQLISPVGLSLLALLPLFAAILIPPGFYSGIVREEDYMFLSARVFFFYLACVICHILGAMVVGYRPDRLRVKRARRRGFESNDWLMIVIPVGVATAIAFVSMGTILKLNPNIIHMIFNGQGNEAKENFQAEGALTGAQPLLMGAFWWGMFRYQVTKRAMTPLQRRISFLVLSGAFLFSALSSVVKLARYEMIPLILGTLIVYLRSAGAGRSAWYFLRIGIFGGFAVMGLFTAFAILRGTDPASSIIGYGPAAFNHLEVVLRGKLDFNGSGQYTTGFLGNVPLLHRYLDIGAIFDLPNPVDAFKREFALTAAAGLNGTLIWITAPGYYYADLGWGVLPWMFGWGLLTGVIWRAFNEQKAWGTVLYPVFAASILLWSTSNFLTRPITITLLGGAILLRIWETAEIWQEKLSADAYESSGVAPKPTRKKRRRTVTAIQDE